MKNFKSGFVLLVCLCVGGGLASAQTQPVIPVRPVLTKPDEIPRLPPVDDREEAPDEAMLDVWQQEVRAVEDEALYDSGLHGSDTESRNSSDRETRCGRGRNRACPEEKPEE